MTVIVTLYRNTALPRCNVALARTHNYARDFKNHLLRGVATVSLTRIVSETVATPLN